MLKSSRSVNIGAIGTGVVLLLPLEPLSAPFSALLTGASFLDLDCSTSNDLDRSSVTVHQSKDQSNGITHRVLNAGGRTSDGSTDL